MLIWRTEPHLHITIGCICSVRFETLLMIIAYAVTTVVLLLYIVYISQQNENYKKKLKRFKSESPVIQEVIAEKPKTRSLVEKVEILEKNMNSMAVTLSDIIVEISKLKHNA